MDIKLSNILSVPAKKDEMDVEFQQNSVHYRGFEYQVTDKTPIHLTLTNLGNQKLHIEASGTITLNIPCDRCLTDVSHSFEIAVDEKLEISDRADNEDLDDINFIKENNLDVDMLVFEEVYVKLPTKNLCKDDCKGICTVCGANLNLGDCGCDRKVYDPRMSDVLDIFNNYFKEV